MSDRGDRWGPSPITPAAFGGTPSPLYPFGGEGRGVRAGPSSRLAHNPLADRLQNLAQEADDEFHVHRPAGEKVHGGEIVLLRPGVDRDVRFLEEEKAGDPPRLELVPVLVIDRGPATPRGVDQDGAEGLDLFEHLSVGEPEVVQEVFVFHGKAFRQVTMSKRACSIRRNCIPGCKIWQRCLSRQILLPRPPIP